MLLDKNFTTLSEMFVNITEHFKTSTHIALMQKSRGETIALTHRDLRSRVDAFAEGLATLGVQKGDRIGIVAENRPEWIISDYAALSLGAVDVPVFPSLTAEQLRWIFDNAGIEIVIVSNDFQLRKILSIAEVIPSLRHAIVMADDVETSDARVMHFAEVTARGEDHRNANPNFLFNRRAAITPDDLATIVYTSGTTGTPKGVMLTHDNIVSNLKGSIGALPEIGMNDLVLSYLPLCHAFERIAGYFMFACGVRSALAESIDKVAENLREVQPTIVTTVPRLLERMYSKIKKKLETNSSREKKIFLWAVNVGRAYQRQRRAGKINPVTLVKFRAANYLVFEKLHALIGGRLRFFISGGAALPAELGEFFEAIGILVLEGYGMTECSPVISVNRFEKHTFGTVGPPIPGIEVTIAADGEILTRGPHVMRGYWRNDDATKEIIDADRWLHTGDIGEIDRNGNIKITDRKKHLFVSSGGKNIAPQHIENELSQSNYIDQIFLIGDARPYIAALIVPEFEMLRSFATAHSIGIAEHAALIANPAIIKLFHDELDRLQTHLANYERVRKFTLLATPFTIESGELTPTQKIKRKVVLEKYSGMIEALYNSFDKN